jgi:soluble lytic murein transglycosylase-like protein
LSGITTDCIEAKGELPTKIDNTATVIVDEKPQTEIFKEYEIPAEYTSEGGMFLPELQEYTYNVCKRYGVDYTLVIAVIEVESAYHYDAKSQCGAEGYMQIIPKWHYDRMARLNVDDIDCPPNNILVGVDYLSELTDKYPTELALSIYNRGFRNENGTGAIDLWEDGIKTTDYSDKVLNAKKRIDEELMLDE